MACFSPENLYGVIGWPLGQTLSPLIHNTAFQALAMPDVYMAWPLRSENLERFISDMPLMKIRGLSVTIPHKIAVMPFLEVISEAASMAGAVNTLYWRENRLCGENTDVTGFLAPLADMRLDQMEVLLLGAGGAAHAVCAALKLRGCFRARVASPGNTNQFPLAERFGFTPVLWEDRYEKAASLVINATPMGMRGSLEGESAYDFSQASGSPGWAYDLVYNPLSTVFLRAAARAGWKRVSGFEMFIAQGEEQFRIWTGREPPASMRAALREALGGEKP